MQDGIQYLLHARKEDPFEEMAARYALEQATANRTGGLGGFCGFKWVELSLCVGMASAVEPLNGEVGPSI